MDHSRFLVRDVRERGAEKIHVVHADRGDDGDKRLDHVGGVQSPAHPHFQHGEIALTSPEKKECDHSQRLEVRGLHPGSACQQAKLANAPAQLGGADIAAVDPPTLLQTHKVRRRVESAAVAGLRYDRRQSRGCRSLAVGSGNDDSGHRVLRIPGGAQQCTHPREPGMPPSALQGLEPLPLVHAA